MKIKDIILNVSTFLGINEVYNYLIESNENKTADADTLTKVDILTRLSNLVINEVSTGFIPMIKSEKISFNNGEYLVSSLTEKALEIKNIYDEYGNKIKFNIFGDKIKTSYYAKIIEYSYVPANYDLSDDIGFDDKSISLSVLSFAVAAEYCLTEWRFEEAVMWRERFTNEIKSFCLPKSSQIKERIWE